MATNDQVTANWIAYQEAMGLGSRAPTQKERQEAIKNYFQTNPEATPDAIAKAATDFGVSAEEIAKATGYTDVAKIQSGLGSYQTTGSTGQTGADYTGGGSTDTAFKVQQDLSSGKISESEAQNRLNKIVGIESIPDVDSTTVYSQSDADMGGGSESITADTLNQIYIDVLGRPVGEEGLGYWLGTMYGGSGLQTEEQLRAAIANTQEGQVVTNIRQYFEDNPNASYQDIANTMNQYGVGSEVVAQATGRDAAEVDQIYKEVTGGIPITSTPFGAQASTDPDIRREVLANQYQDLFGREPDATALEYWITGEGKAAPLTATVLLNAAAGEDLQTYNQRVESGETTPKYFNDPNLNVMANAYAQGDIDRVNQLVRDGKYTYNDIQNMFGMTDDQIEQLKTDGVQEYELVLKYYLMPDGTLGTTYGDELPAGAELVDEARYNELLAGQTQSLVYYQLADGTVGTVYGEENVPQGATQISQSQYQTLVNSGTTSVSPNTATSGNIVTGVPQVGEVNIMDFMGLQAGQPTLPLGTKLETQIEELDAEAVGTELGDISTADKTKLATETDAILSSEIDKVGSMVEGTYTVPGQVTIPSSEGITTDIVTEAEFTEAGVPSEFVDPVTGKLKTDENLATMTAKKSYTDIDEEATAFTSAKQELAEVNPLATVTGQLAILQEQFADGEVPVWASGAFRQVNALMAQRGIGGSTMAAEAITNALMQSAIPIAQQDASFYQNVTLQNLSNEQQAEMAKFNSRTAAIFNDQAAVNAARSLNTQSENELTQFFASLATQVSTSNAQMSNAMEQFNATAKNQMTQFFEELGLTAETFNADALNELAQFDAEQANIIAQFNASMKDQRERFNVQNQLAIDASNVQWRRDVNTANTSATNAALQFDAQNLLGIQQTALNNIWQHYDTLLNYAFQSEESAANRANQLVIASMNAELQRQIAEESADSDLISGIFKAGATLLGSDTGNTVVKKYLGIK